MAFTLSWSLTAKRCEGSLLLHEQDNPVAARDFALSILSAVEQLCIFPNSGRMVPEFKDPGIREIIRKPCRIVYRVHESRASIEIVHVWYAARGVPEL